MTIPHITNSYTPQTLRYQQFNATNGNRLLSNDNYTYYDLDPDTLNSNNILAEKYSSKDTELQICDSMICREETTRINSSTVIYQGVQNSNVYPSGVVKIITKFGDNFSDDSYGSGCIVDDHVIATAAHVIYDKNHSTTTNCAVKCVDIVLFAQNGTVISSQNITPVEFHVPQGFISNQTNVDGFDFALITVEEDLSDYISLDLSLALPEFIYSGATVNDTGSPVEVDNTDLNNYTNLHNLVTTAGRITYDSTVIIGADCACAKSGSPLYVPNDNSLVGITVSTGGIQHLGSTAIRSEMFQFYYNNQEIDY